MSCPFEVFHTTYTYCRECDQMLFVGESVCDSGHIFIPSITTLWHSGWFWWYCFPGCLPDSDPYGPFASYDAAEIDALETGLDEEE